LRTTRRQTDRPGGSRRRRRHHDAAVGQRHPRWGSGRRCRARRASVLRARAQGASAPRGPARVVTKNTRSPPEPIGTRGHRGVTSSSRRGASCRRARNRRIAPARRRWRARRRIGMPRGRHPWRVRIRLPSPALHRPRSRRPRRPRCHRPRRPARASCPRSAGGVSELRRRVRAGVISRRSARVEHASCAQDGVARGEHGERKGLQSSPSAPAAPNVPPACACAPWPRPAGTRVGYLRSGESGRRGDVEVRRVRAIDAYRSWDRSRWRTPRVTPGSR